MNECPQSTWGDEGTPEDGKALRSCSETAGRVRVFGISGSIGWIDMALAPGSGVVLERKRLRSIPRGPTTACGEVALRRSNSWRCVGAPGNSMSRCYSFTAPRAAATKAPLVRWPPLASTSRPVAEGRMTSSAGS